MVTFVCRTCGQEGELQFGSPAGWFFCDDECYSEFSQVVEHLAAGGDPEEIGLDPWSRLCREAMKDVQARRRREITEKRELKARELEREKPQAMRPLYPV